MPIPRLPFSFPIPQAVLRPLDAAIAQRLHPPEGPHIDFTLPKGEAALVAATSLSWQIFKNPVSLFIGGVAAVILELAEPRVRTGVWEHSTFRSDPVTRLQRTGLAAMITVYGARSVAEAMIAGVVRRHETVRGDTPLGQAYHANDVDLLTWVQATAGFGFTEAYSRYVRPLSHLEKDQAFLEAGPAAHLYGAINAPASWAQWQALLHDMHPHLEPSPIVFEFLQIMTTANTLPGPLRAVQPLLVRAAVEMTPQTVRDVLGLTSSHGLNPREYGLKPWEDALVTQAGRMADRLRLPSYPAVQSCVRLGLTPDFLY